MADDISDAEALMRVELQHAGNEVFEVLGVEALTLALGLRMGLPEEVRPVRGDELVVTIVLAGLGEGRVA